MRNLRIEPARDLAEHLRTAPAAFADVQAMARTAGVGTAKLDFLCRRFFHLSPAEMLDRARIDAARRHLSTSSRSISNIASDVGFAALPAFSACFRRLVGLSPSAYRGLPRSERFTLDLPPWLDRRRLLTYLGRDPKSLHQQVDGERFAFALELDGEARTVVVELGRGEAVVRLPSAGGAWAAEAHQRVRRMLGLTGDPLPFEGRAARVPQIRRLLDGQRGLTVPRTPDLDDACIWVIAGQQVSLASAFSIRRRLAERYGRPVQDGSGLLAPTPLARLAELEEADLVGVGFSRRKAEYLHALARASGSSQGGLDLKALERSPWPALTAPEIEQKLLAVRGLGPWSVNYLMMRGLGLADCVPVGDVALAESLKRFFDLDARPQGDAVREHMEVFAPDRSLATFHLWHRLGNAQ